TLNNVVLRCRVCHDTVEDAHKMFEGTMDGIDYREDGGQKEACIKMVVGNW
ncbi:UNVERIFIED_CONTAM: hypothetical protein K2H54_075864, partial [Gekko kuhli]